MTEPIKASFYGIKNAATSELVLLSEAGNEQARDELRSRLPQKLVELFDIYLVAYGDRGHALDALACDLSYLKAAA